MKQFFKKSYIKSLLKGSFVSLIISYPISKFLTNKMFEKFAIKTQGSLLASQVSLSMSFVIQFLIIVISLSLIISNYKRFANN